MWVDSKEHRHVFGIKESIYFGKIEDRMNVWGIEVPMYVWGIEEHSIVGWFQEHTYIPGIEDFFKCQQNLRSDICLRNQGTINCLSMEST